LFVPAGDDPRLQWFRLHEHGDDRLMRQPAPVHWEGEGIVRECRFLGFPYDYLVSLLTNQERAQKVLARLMFT
jgi:hypothetical protein